MAGSSILVYLLSTRTMVVDGGGGGTRIALIVLVLCCVTGLGISEVLPHTVSKIANL
jgi:hypothetical protein